MTFEESQSYSEELEALRYFPANANARVLIQKTIAEICETPRQARRLVDEMTKRHSEWPGPATLRQIHAELFGVRGKEEEWQGFGEPPPLGCTRCRDFGWVRDGGRHIRCSCDMALHIEDVELAALDRIYRKPEAPAVRIGAEKPTAEEMEAVLRRAIANRRIQ